MNEAARLALKQRVVDHLRTRDALRDLPPEILPPVVEDWILTLAPTSEALPEAAVLETLAARALARAQMTTEERTIRAKLAAQLGSSLDDLEAIVQRQFEGATRSIADRHTQAVRLDRTRGLIEAVLHGLGGHGATLEQILTGAGRAVAVPVLEVFGETNLAELERRLRETSSRVLSPVEVEELLRLLRQRRGIPSTDAAAVGQVAQAASQAVQQVAVNVQKIVTVALEAARAADETDPRYYYP
ncbi:MAG: hypothetical protein IT580_19545 [Verrucomicrobiales bacterium]|nr:hypothetical protein [Verrucomicrobiales bacterium]